MGRSSGYKLNITDEFTQNYFIDNSVGKKCHVTIRSAFLNPIVIPSIILLVYTERLFQSVYLRMNFYHWVNSVGKVVGKSYMSSYFSRFFYSFFSNYKIP